MRISFLDFWGGFDQNNNFFIHLLRRIYDNVIVSSPESADLIIYTVFGQQNKKYNHCKKIFFTGENIRPNFDECDYSLTFDFDDYNNRNIRLPLWYLYIDWFDVGSYTNPHWLIPTKWLCGENEFTKKSKEKFCSTVFSSRYKIRFDLIEKLNIYKEVDCYGKLHNRRLPDGERNKMDTISNYKFSICLENTIHPGYFTEKLLHAKIAGTIPIYYSDKTFNLDFNEKCCVNLIDYDNMDAIVDMIKMIDSDKSLYEDMLNQPLFDHTASIADIAFKIMKVL